MKKINLRKVSDVLSDGQLKRVFGGYGTGCVTCVCFDNGIPVGPFHYYDCGYCKTLCDDDYLCSEWCP